MSGGMSPDRALQWAGVARDHYLTQDELASRWRLSPRTLERWRRQDRGPAWVRLPGRVLYHVEDVRDYERAQLQVPLD